MKISIIGLGYVGLPLAGLLSRDFQVVGFDNNLEKVREVLDGHETIFEPGLSELLSQVMESGHLKITTNIGDVREADAKIITVGTPYDLDTG